MNLDVLLWVWLKGVDLVANTAYLTLTEKMGYDGKLLGLKRLDAYRLSLETRDPEATVSTLQRTLSTQSTFYNRNKHNYFLQCCWETAAFEEGLPVTDVRQRLAQEVYRRVSARAAKDFVGGEKKDRVILEDVPIFRTEILIEDLDTAARSRLASHLKAELSIKQVTISVLGTCWYLALCLGSEGEAKSVAEEIVVTKTRNMGLLLNPNGQAFKTLSVEPMEINQ
jgi:hypothetical protein